MEGGAKKGEWKLSNWLAEENLFGTISSKLGSRADGLGGPKKYEHNGKTYLLSMRSQRMNWFISCWIN